VKQFQFQTGPQCKKGCRPLFYCMRLLVSTYCVSGGYRVCSRAQTWCDSFVPETLRTTFCSLSV